jgi:hypothetical protein
MLFVFRRDGIPEYEVGNVMINTRQVKSEALCDLSNAILTHEITLQIPFPSANISLYKGRYQRWRTSVL